MIIVRDSVSMYVRQRDALYARMKKQLKFEVQLTGEECSLFLKWQNNQLQDEMYTIHKNGTIYKQMLDNLCILTVKEEQAIKRPDVFYYLIYTPFPDTFNRWLETGTRRKALIADVLRDLHQEDTRSFGERMRDLRKERLTG